MSILELEENIRKYYGFLTLLCVLLGFLLPQFSFLSQYVPFLLAILVFSMVVEHEISDFALIIKHPKTVIALITSNFILYPLIGFLFLHLLLSSQSGLINGIILLCFAPSPVIAALWTEMSGGDGTISISTALFSMILSIGVYPFILFYLGIVSPAVSIEIFKLLALSVFVPVIIALFIKTEKNLFNPSKREFKLVSAITGLLIIVIAISKMASQFFSNEFITIILISSFVTVLLLAGLFYGYSLSRLLKVKNEYKKAFLYTSSMRDGIIPLTVALSYFTYSSTIPSTVLLIIMPFIVAIVYQILKKMSIDS